MMHFVAVLLTCHNRRETTLRCLRALEAQTLPVDWKMRTYLVDDGSTDGTSAAVASAHSNVVLLDGTGELYWTGGMMLADEAAMAGRPDFLLWLNDDVELHEGAIELLINSAERTGKNAIVIGTTIDRDSKVPTYGAYQRTGRPLDLELITPNGTLQRADTMNGNVVLIPRTVRERTGSLEARFTHNMADMDYGFRAVDAGFDIVVAPTPVGACRKNTEKASWSDPEVPFRHRIRSVRSFKGLPPRQWLRFTVRHTGWWWPRYFLGPYVRVILGRSGQQ
jgi:GT2 family glycosyltransferase